MNKMTKRILILIAVVMFLFAFIRISTSTYENMTRDARSVIITDSAEDPA